jgi:hypothetical protein
VLNTICVVALSPQRLPNGLSNLLHTVCSSSEDLVQRRVDYFLEVIMEGMHTLTQAALESSAPLGEVVEELARGQYLIRTLMCSQWTNIREWGWGVGGRG